MEYVSCTFQRYLSSRADGWRPSVLVRLRFQAVALLGRLLRPRRTRPPLLSCAPAALALLVRVRCLLVLGPVLSPQAKVSAPLLPLGDLRGGPQAQAGTRGKQTLSFLQAAPQVRGNALESSFTGEPGRARLGLGAWTHAGVPHGCREVTQAC